MSLGSIKRLIQGHAQDNERFKGTVNAVANLIGYDLTRVTRKAYVAACRELINGLHPASLDCCEISASENADWRHLGYRSYRSLDYPAFDLCVEPLDANLAGQFDLVIADQVFEHLLWPYRGGKNVLQLLRPGGHALIMTPFLIRIHSGPHDCSRWTETGMRHLLAECGFPIEDIRTWSWGNRAVVRSALETWPRMGWKRDMPNDRQYPIVVWTLARKAS